MRLYNIYKQVGQTPLEALEAFRKKRKISALAKLTYIGRLDPMASGVLLILQNATQADREKYMGLSKEYEVRVCLGFSTDSYDLLGLPKLGKHRKLSKEIISDNINKYLSISNLKVPPYSSVPYKGKPLFEWARADGLKNIKLPSREFKVKSVKLKGLQSLSAKQLISYISSSINKVKGDFRQEKILKAWKKLLSGSKKNFLISNFLISVSAGTYIRSIAHDLGKKLGTGGVVYSLERTRVGRYKITNNK